MLDISKLNRAASLARSISPDDVFLYLPYGSGYYMKPAKSLSYYATLRSGNKMEVVLVIGAGGDVLSVERGKDGTQAQAFPAGSCINVEWNPAQLCEFVQTCVTADKPITNPGVYCLECRTCIEVDAYGRITKISGGGNAESS